jgi:hypothetical protein
MRESIMKSILAVAVVLGMACATYATSISGYANLVQSNVATFDPFIFAAGPNVDVYEYILENPNQSDVTSLSLTFVGDFVNKNFQPLTFKNDGSTGLPMLGPNLVAETFFNLPTGAAPLAVDIVDTNAQLSASYTVAGDVALIPAGGSTVVATLSLPAGADFFSIGHPTCLGQAAVGGELVDVLLHLEGECPNVPEPSTIWIASLALVGFVMRRK